MKTLVDNEEILVRINSSGEIFYRYKALAVEVRISRNVVMAWDNVWLTPTSANGLPAFRLQQQRTKEDLERGL